MAAHVSASTALKSDCVQIAEEQGSASTVVTSISADLAALVSASMGARSRSVENAADPRSLFTTASDINARSAKDRASVSIIASSLLAGIVEVQSSASMVPRSINADFVVEVDFVLMDERQPPAAPVTSLHVRLMDVHIIVTGFRGRKSSNVTCRLLMVTTRRL